jgi:predicted ATPase/transcriptional regulator with GAF, ATPase, and Fis domain
MATGRSASADGRSGEDLLPGYVVGEVLAATPYLLRRATTRGDQTPVLLKSPEGGARDPVRAAALRREHELIGGLTMSGVPRAVGFEPRSGTLVLEDFGGQLLRSLVAPSGVGLDVFFAVARQLCRTLSELHRLGIVNRGLNPGAVLVHPTTHDTQLFDFAVASSLPQEAHSGGTAAVPPGHLAYMSPEQTGRMNRAVDHRSDLYSLGVVLYELLTGRTPFDSGDPLELVHAHIARAPAAPSDIAPSVPAPLGQIVMKLLAKTAEERYQTAWGVAADIDTCFEGRAARLEPFPLGAKDVPDRFTLPQRLYGREREVAELLQAFEATSEGPARLVLIGGYSGVGKTSLVHEVHKPIARRRGRFVSGKFDQLDRATPYAALLEALRDLVRQLLTSSESRLAPLREGLSRALGVNAGVLGAVIPELAWLMGPSPPVPLLGPAESQNRFHYLLQEFLGVLATPDSPLVVFLDDVQWADSATLRLLPQLVTSSRVRSVLFVGAYRDNEVPSDHPLMKTAAEIRQAGAAVTDITLAPLRLPDLEQLVADALLCVVDRARPLAALVQRKTDGNPFFVTQFLKALHRDGLLQFEHGARRWTFDLDRIEKAAITENVVDLMTGRLRRLRPSTRQAVTLAACIGPTFSLQTLAVAGGTSLREAASDLREAVAEGLVVPGAPHYEQLDGAPEDVLQAVGPSYRFLHDRVQQAAYALIPAPGRPPVHLRVGRRLLAEHGDRAPEATLFDIVNHLNLGRELITDEGERERLVRLNLQAGRRARDSAAFRAALGYFARGSELLPGERWRAAYDLSAALTLELAECHYLCGNFEEAERCFESLLRESRSPLEKADAHRMRLVQYESMTRYGEALEVGRDALRLFGVELPRGEAATRAALDEEIRRIEEALGGRSIASLVDLPTMADPDRRMILTLLTAMWASAYILGDATLAFLLSARMVHLSVAHGNTEDSAYGYVTHAISVGPVRGDYRAAYEWGSLALAVNDRLEDRKRRAKIHQQFHAHVSPWRRPFAAALPHAREACRSGLETGDFTYAGYGAFTETWVAMLTASDLDRFVRDYGPTVALLGRIRMTALADAQELFLNWARALQGRTARPTALSYGTFDEDGYVAAYKTNPFCMTFLYALRAHLGLLFGEHASAIEAARTARSEAWTPPGTIWPVLLDFWAGLAMAGRYPDVPPATREEYGLHLARTSDSLRALADNCPENFRCPSLLLGAEIERLAGRTAEGAGLLEQAVAFARETGSLQHEALAHELLAKLWLGRGDEARAAAAAKEARRAYAAWGAAAKVKDLEARYARWLRPLEPAAAASGWAHLDVATALKAARAIVSEIETDRLLRTLVRIAIENAGAQRGLLLREAEDGLSVAAEGSTAEGDVVLAGATLASREDLPHTIVRLVHRTGQSVLVDDARQDSRWLDDPYVAKARPLSILCVPIVHQGRRAGLFYLENNLATGAFVAERIETLEILSAEAAIALENARLYEDMRQEVERRSRAEAALREALAELERLKNRLQQENVYLQEELRTQHNFEEIVGASPALLDALKRVEHVSRTEATVLILGETGSGKELFARAIHSRGSRRNRPLVKVNCGAIPAGLVESELFGHVKGAFTGALQARTGRFELAHGGTIFLDEVGELPLDTQVKLLRVLQEQEFEPVGSSRTVRVDVRVIAATNRDVENEVREGRFRADLLYRLNVFPIRVPSLRERASDIPLLATFLLTGLSKKLGKPFQGFSRRSMDRLVAYSWPGNVRELQNIVERAAIVSPGPIIELDLHPLGAPGGSAAAAGEATTLEQVERAHIVSVLRETRGVVEGPRGAASVLGLHPNTLRSRMKKLGIQRQSS